MELFRARVITALAAVFLLGVVLTFAGVITPQDIPAGPPRDIVEKLPVNKPDKEVLTILAEAKKIDAQNGGKTPYVWGGGHPASAFIGGAHAGVDCSGLVNVAFKRTTGITDDHTTDTIERSRFWKKISFRKVRKGDLLYRRTQYRNGQVVRVGHVVIVVKNYDSKKFLVFEARTRHDALSEQIRESTRSRLGPDGFDGALRLNADEVNKMRKSGKKK